VIRREWDAVCDAGGLSRDERDRLRGRQFLNPFALEGFADV
jgi:serine/threonine-protein kinase HipA